MSSVFSADGYAVYPPFRALIAGGVRRVAVDRVLEKRDPAAYSFLLQLARDNQLKLRAVHKAMRPEHLVGEAVAAPGAPELDPAG